MDDDLFGPSVWGLSDVSPISPPDTKGHVPFSTQAPENEFDEFDDFGAPAESTTDGGPEDDDFGDFGDFGEAPEMGFSEEVGFGEEVRIAGPSTRDWQPLQLDPFPSREELQEQIDVILAPLWGDKDISQVTTDEDVRRVEGLSQILVTPESRAFYDELVKPPPPMEPPNWTRSKIRRQHLIALGIPVNLDEVLPRANGKALPPLQITTRPMSAPPGPRPGVQSNVGSPVSRTGTPSRSGTPQPNPRSRQSTVAQLGLGPKPELDEAAINNLLDITPDSLSLMPLPVLESRLTELRNQTVNTSSFLTYLLQTRDALQQDSETYNTLIAELVGEAQKMKTGKGKAPVRRSSGRR
ncbi:hypothetical protein JAAARDRAFT_201685 [Jaapia argillacea MUCL 33604]|uniref:Uncharacterized protein n=1 Tax=Jaapia argillacea MUCL 33604 TaxID=933084 RepID=A0A067QB85_9AGAM|nr:hypothetical protein JAAARDRAFT_201685 [Jaapia argillacea MUCL 33604]